jgi:four helix bundle protein
VIGKLARKSEGREMQDFRNLKIWESAHALTLVVYRLTRSFPKEEQYGLTNQVRRAAVSIPANIAEGCGRRGDPEFARFLQIAMGSASELDYELLLARDLKYLAPSAHEEGAADLASLRRMMNAMLGKVRSKPMANSQ